MHTNNLSQRMSSAGAIGASINPGTKRDPENPLYPLMSAGDAESNANLIELARQQKYKNACSTNERGAAKGDDVGANGGEDGPQVTIPPNVGKRKYIAMQDIRAGMDGSHEPVETKRTKRVWMEGPRDPVEPKLTKHAG